MRPKRITHWGLLQAGRRLLDSSHAEGSGVSSPSTSAYVEDLGTSNSTSGGSTAIDLGAFGSVYQSLFAMSGVAIQQTGGNLSSSYQQRGNGMKSPRDSTNKQQQSFNLTGIIPANLLEENDERPFPCAFCEARFKKKQHLQNHERIHTGEKYMCSVCGQGFSRRHILKQHVFKKHLQHLPHHQQYDCISTASQNGGSSSSGGGLSSNTTTPSSTPVSPSAATNSSLLPLLHSSVQQPYSSTNNSTSSNKLDTGDALGTVAGDHGSVMSVGNAVEVNEAAFETVANLGASHSLI